MESKYDQLEKLKALLDAGALSQEEFESAKKRILNAEEPNPNTTQVPSVPNVGKISSSSSKSTSKKWILWGAGGVLALVVLFVVIGNKNDDYQPNTYGDPGMEAAQAEADAHFEEVLAMAAEMNGDDGLTLGNPWRKDYFHNEWDEEITDSPFLYAILDGSAWDIQIDYIPPTDELRWGVFRFYLLDNDYRKTSSYGPVNILVRGSDGETRIIEVTGTRAGFTFVENPSAIELLKHYLNQETFDIRMDFEKYNERHSTQARWESSPQSFQEATTKLL